MTAPSSFVGMSLEQLAKLVKKSIASSRKNAARALDFGRKSSVDLFNAGQALVAVRTQLEINGLGYCEWLKEQKIPRTSAHEAVKLFEAAGTVEAVKDLPITEAKVKFGIVKAKPAKEHPTKPNDAVNNELAGESEPESKAEADDRRHFEPMLNSEPQRAAYSNAQPVNDSNPSTKATVVPPEKEPEGVSKVLAMIVQRLEALAEEGRKDDESVQVERLISRALIVLETIRSKHGVRINDAA